MKISFSTIVIIRKGIVVFDRLLRSASAIRLLKYILVQTFHISLFYVSSMLCSLFFINYGLSTVSEKIRDFCHHPRSRPL